jgi:hypothetical protein
MVKRRGKLTSFFMVARPTLRQRLAATKREQTSSNVTKKVKRVR